MIYFIFCIFITELALGFNGKFFLINNISIRYYLFTILLFTLCVKSYSVIKQFLSKNCNNFTYNDKIKCLLNNYFSTFDKLLFLFLIINSLWIFIIPLLNNTQIKFSLKECLCLSMFLLYFPIVILIKDKIFNWNICRKYIKLSILCLTIIHIILYIGETIVGDASFTLNIFEKIVSITNGTRPTIMMPESYIRIIYPASILLIMMFYFPLRDRDINDNDFKFVSETTLFILLGICGIFTTVTKSLIYGIIIGMVTYYILSIIHTINNRKSLNLKKTISITFLVIVSSIIFNYTLFDNFIFNRLKNSFVISNENFIYEDSTVHMSFNDPRRYKEELEGSKRANRTRIIQMEKIVDTWKQKPLLGIGYGGSCNNNYLRSSKNTPYSYEMAGLALLMKIGIIGISIWLVFFIYVLYTIIFKLAYKDSRIISVIYLLITLGVSTQFNSFLFSSFGMFIILFCFLEMKYIELNN